MPSSTFSGSGAAFSYSRRRADVLTGYVGTSDSGLAGADIGTSLSWVVVVVVVVVVDQCEIEVGLKLSVRLAEIQYVYVHL